MPISTIGSAGLTTAGIAQTNLGTNVAGNGPAFFGYQNSAQSVSANTYTKINLQATLFDTNTNFSSSRFTPTVAGYYQVNASLSTTTSLTSTTYFNVYISKNGSTYVQTTAYPAPSNYFSAFIGAIVYLNGSTDYVELYGQSNSVFTVQAGSSNTFFNGALVRSA
jgi:hypothetical protein